MRASKTLKLIALSAVMAFLLTGCGLLPIPEGELEIEFWASQEVVPPGGCVLLRWEVRGAEDYPVFLNGEQVSPSGEEEVCLERPETFELVVGATGGPQEERVTIEVEGEVPPEEPPPGEPPPQEPPPEEPPLEGGPEVIILVADPDAIPHGGCAMLHWEVLPPAEWRVLLDGQEVPPVGEREVCPEGTTAYELLVEAPGGPEERHVTLQVESEPAPEPTPPPAPTPPPGPTPVPSPTSLPSPTPVTPTPGLSVDIRPTDLYADGEPHGVMWVRIVNNGPGTLTNKKVQISGSETRSTLAAIPSAQGQNIPPQEYSLPTLAPGQQATINLGWPINTSQYYYQFTVNVAPKGFTDPNTGNNSYTEGVGPGFSASYVNVHICGSNFRYATFRLENTGTMAFESEFLTISPGYPGGSNNNPFTSGPNGCPPGNSSLAPGGTAYTAANIGNSHGAATATVKLCTQDNVAGVCVERMVNFTLP